MKEKLKLYDRWKKIGKNYMKDKTFKKMIMIIHINGVSKNRIYLSIFFFFFQRSPKEFWKFKHDLSRSENSSGQSHLARLLSPRRSLHGYRARNPISFLSRNRWNNYGNLFATAGLMISVNSSISSNDFRWNWIWWGQWYSRCQDFLPDWRSFSRINIIDCCLWE